MRAAEHAVGGTGAPAATEHDQDLLTGRIPDREWMDRAACRDRVSSPATDVFFAPDAEETGSRAAAAREARRRELIALAICDRCPVRARCLVYAVRTRQSFGVWGGRTEQQLRQLIAQADPSGPVGRAPHIDRGIDRRPAGERVTHCPAGHPYDEANIRRYGNRRVCIACQRARALARQRALAATRTRCPAGHPYDEANTSYDACGRRKCRACARARGQAEPRRIAVDRARRVARGWSL